MLMFPGCHSQEVMFPGGQWPSIIVETTPSTPVETPNVAPHGQRLLPL